ncbi:MAG: hypothetical protein WCT07_01395 [Candidatus Paceibacterota bacterium]|jgi:hypothetical protein
MKKFWIFLITTLFIIPTFAYAEIQASLKINPENPAPYEPATITLNSYDIDINNSMITWSVSGKKITSGVGIKKISITVGGANSVIPISVRAKTSAGDIIELSINVTPQSVDLIWETPEGYVPPFYEGKSLPGEGAVIKVTALPSMSENGKPVSANNLSYAWYVNGEYKDSISGQGRQTVNINLDYLSNRTDVKVKVRSAGGAVSEKTITITPHEVMPVFYVYNDILGINFSQLLNRRIETTREIAISLVPYYLSTKNFSAGADSYTWLLDSLPFTPQENTLVRLKPKENSQGTKTLSVLISNSKRSLQKAQANLVILFDTRK